MGRGDETRKEWRTKGLLLKKRGPGNQARLIRGKGITGRNDDRSEEKQGATDRHGPRGRRDRHDFSSIQRLFNREEVEI